MPLDAMLLTDEQADRHATVSAARAAVRAAYRMDEETCVTERLEAARIPSEMQDRVEDRARKLVEQVRENRINTSSIDAFMHEYELSSKEGVVLMCMAEALLRIPDEDTVDALIKDKIGGANWESHLGHSESWFVNASTWALMLTGRVVNVDADGGNQDWRGVFRKLINRSGEPVIRQAVTQAMRVMGRQFVMGRGIKDACKRAETMEKKGYRYSYDMLGEAARTMADAERYFEEYANAIDYIGRQAKGKGPIEAAGISVKLSALHPRYEFTHEDRVFEELRPKLLELCRLAKQHDIGLCIDAEEADRLDISMDMIRECITDPGLSGWQGLGLALQAYQKRAYPMVDWLAETARTGRKRLLVRLVKGAYWDTEIKRAQELGLPDYPVFTRKASTDISYLACAKKMLEDDTAFYPCFASHNAHTVAAVMEMAGNRQDYEFQRLHGMGDALYDQIVGTKGTKNPGGRPVRIYAPVGSHEDLLAYLVRRLLENGANSSFVNRIVDEKLPISDIIADPIRTVERWETKRHPNIPLPRDLYGANRPNAKGTDISDPPALIALREEMTRNDGDGWHAAPLVGGVVQKGKARDVHSPADRRRKIGTVVEADAGIARDAFERATRAHVGWDDTPANERAACLERAADLFEENEARLMAVTIREAGKTLNDAVAEIREAVDFMRYYANRARADFAAPQVLPGPTGEHNQISLHGRGVFLCISPWNFPLAIFTGQVSAALAAGNCVLAKPAEQTPLVAFEAVKLLHRAGIPGDVLHLLPGDGPTIGNAVLSDPRLGGVAFTGSTATARLINRKLAERDGPIVPLIAETGGQNAMIVDSSALPEQVTRDVLISSFQSAGQRCSALRCLYVQEDIADKQLEMIAGAMKELKVGDPAWLSTDLGPVIDEEAQTALKEHTDSLRRVREPLFETALGPDCDHGTFVAPIAFEIDGINDLDKEHFGPILHVVRFRSKDQDAVVDQINGTGFGLTCAIHSRIDATAERLVKRLRVGNAYVNRNQIGAIVGVQPFGGEGLSGTGPKAGGPRYLHRFAAERTLSVDTTAAGGNASLMSMED